jgi:hypothetical protein
VLRALLALALLWLGAGGATAQVLPQGPVLAAADLREGVSLDGTWTYSIDPYRDGVAGFHGDPAGRGHARWDDVDVEQARAADPLALFEYDMDTAPRAHLPASWLTHAPEMRHYQGLVWYQRRFDASPQPGMRYFLRFGAANYTAEAWLNGRPIGRHEGGFTPFAFEVTGMLRETGNRLTVGGGFDAHRPHRPAAGDRLGNLWRDHPLGPPGRGPGKRSSTMLGAAGRRRGGSRSTSRSTECKRPARPLRWQFPSSVSAAKRRRMGMAGCGSRLPRHACAAGRPTPRSSTMWS